MSNVKQYFDHLFSVDDTGSDVYYGYDGLAYDNEEQYGLELFKPRLTDAECVELADLMISRWQVFRGRHTTKQED